MLFLSFEISRLGIRSKAMSVVFFLLCYFLFTIFENKKYILYVRAVGINAYSVEFGFEKRINFCESFEPK